jgi:uncharacterized protein (DUF1499 family)
MPNKNPKMSNVMIENVTRVSGIVTNCSPSSIIGSSDFNLNRARPELIRERMQ